jgi:hypothetical protein
MLIIMVGCRSLPHDKTPAPINNNKMTLELQACEKQEVGLIGCSFNERQDGSLKIPVWYAGEYQIKSEKCDYTYSSRYEGTQIVEHTFQDLLANKPEKDDTCLFNIKVFIDEFDNGFEGFLLLSKEEFKATEFSFKNQQYIGYLGIQLKEGQSLEDKFVFKAETPGLIFWDGCQNDGDKEYEKNPEISFKEIITGFPTRKDSCVLSIGLIPEDESLPVELAKIHINIFEKPVADLPRPVITYNKNKEKLTVRADKLVAVIGIGNNYSIKKGNGKKKFTAYAAKDQEINVRIATSNGRFMLLKVKNGEVLWIK